MARFLDELQALYEKKILLDIYIGRLKGNETYEVAIMNRTGLSRKFVHRTLTDFTDVGLLEVYETVGQTDCYRLTPHGFAMIAELTKNKRSRKYFLSSSVKFEHPQQRPPSPGRRSG